MEYLVYSFDPRVAKLGDIKNDLSSRHLSPERRASIWQHEDGDDEHARQVEDIVASTRPLRMRL